MILYTMIGDRSRAAGLVGSGFLSRCSAVGSKKVDCGFSRGAGAYVVGLWPVGGGDL